MSRDFWTDNNSKLLEFLSNLSGLSAMGTNRIQQLSLFDSLLANLTELFNASSSYIHMQIPSKAFESNIFRRSHGIPLDYCINLNKLTMTTSTSVLDTNYQYQYNVEHQEEDRYAESIKMLGIKSIVSVPILGTDKKFGVFNLYYTENFTLSPQMISSMHTLGELLASMFMSSNSQISVFEEIMERNEFFYHTSDYIFVMDGDYNLKDVNKRSALFLGTTTTNTQLNFTGLITSQIALDTFLGTLKSMANDSLSKEEIITLASPTVVSEEMTFVFVFTKIVINTETVYIASGRPFMQEVRKFDSGMISTDENIMQQLNDYYRAYQINPSRAIENYIDIFFPASFSLTLNEITGPIILTSSPELDKYAILQEVIKLMSSLNVEQMLEQTYTTGSMPWSRPAGDFYWIAFIISNPKARGGVEMHLIGLVVKQHLITSKPTLLQSLLGNLLGGMNDFRSIILEDEADFVTTVYNDDRNYSTITLIKESLGFIRHIAMEILGTLNSDFV